MKKIVIILLILFGLLFSYVKMSKPKMESIKIGDKVPTFSLYNQNGNKITINDSLKRPMVIYFYPKDETPGCIKEACKFRDEFEKFTDLNVLVVGISGDNIASHKKFEQKYNLPFMLLADVKNVVRKLFGVPKSLIFLPGRVTYIVDKEGVVQYIFNSQFNVEKHIETAISILNKM